MTEAEARQKLLDTFSNVPDAFSYEGLLKTRSDSLKVMCRLLDMPTDNFDRGLAIEHLWWKMQNGLTVSLPPDFCPYSWWPHRMKIVVKVGMIARSMSCLATDLKDIYNRHYSGKKKYPPSWVTRKRVKRIFKNYSKLELYDSEADLLYMEFKRYYARLYGFELHPQKMKIRWSSVAK